MMRSALFGEDMQKILTVVDSEGSDSAMFDNVLELLTLTGRELPHAMMMMVPEPWNRHESMTSAKRAFYEFHSCLMEPWDGPRRSRSPTASRVGGARPERPAPLALLRDEGRPRRHGVGGRRPRHPGRPRSSARAGCSRAACSSSTRPRGRIVSDEELKERIAKQHPTASGSSATPVTSTSCPGPAGDDRANRDGAAQLEVFGYTRRT